MRFDKPPKVYIHGIIGRQHDIEALFSKLGVENPMEYKFGTPDMIYYVNKDNLIMTASIDSDLYYVITNSNDWKELKIRPPRKERNFIVTVMEGSNTCDGCEAYNKCTELQKSKCRFAKELNNLTNGNILSGKGLSIKEVL